MAIQPGAQSPNTKAGSHFDIFLIDCQYSSPQSLFLIFPFVDLAILAIPLVDLPLLVIPFAEYLLLEPLYPSSQCVQDSLSLDSLNVHC